MPVPATLTAIAGPQNEWQRLLPLTPVVLGRAADCDLVLDDNSVSRRHARLWVDAEGRWQLRDLKSRNCTRINGVIVEEQAVGDGDVIGIGRFSLRFNAAAAAGASQERDDREDDVTIDRLDRLRPPRLSAQHVSAVLSLGRSLQALPDASSRLERLLDLAIAPELGGWWSYALRVSPAPGGELAIEPMSSPRSSPDGSRHEPHISRTALRTVLEGREPVVAMNVKGAAKFQAELTVMPGAPTTGAVACPLRERGEAVEVLYVILPAMLASIEWLMLFNLAAEQYRHADAAWAALVSAQARATIEHEMELARGIQRRTLPTRSGAPALDWAVRFDLHDAGGGDYVDVIARDDGTVLLAIADVAGKGLQAALITAGLHAILHAGGAVSTPLGDLVGAADCYLRDFLPARSFVTLTALVLDPRTGDAVCVNCGHPPMIALSPDGVLREIEGGDNFPLGVSEAEIVSTPSRLGPGEWLVAYTDGVSELGVAQGRMLGIAGWRQLLLDAFSARCPASAEELASRLIERLDAYVAGALPSDDRTLLVARTPPGETVSPIRSSEP